MRWIQMQEIWDAAIGVGSRSWNVWRALTDASFIARWTVAKLLRAPKGRFLQDLRMRLSDLSARKQACTDEVTVLVCSSRGSLKKGRTHEADHQPAGLR